MAANATEPVDLSRRRIIPMRHAKSSFDSAKTTHENRRHWSAADGLSADAAASAAVRRTLRNRARYEVANNSYARGIVLTLANDTIGTGPRLQMLTDDDDTNRAIEREFACWSMAVGLPETLRTMRMARAQDGESFGILSTNPRVAHEIQLDVKLVEPEQVASPWGSADRTAATPGLLPSAIEQDGILLDSFGNPHGCARRWRIG